jgi:hypothetical protein
MSARRARHTTVEFEVLEGQCVGFAEGEQRAQGETDAFALTRVAPTYEHRARTAHRQHFACEARESDAKRPARPRYELERLEPQVSLGHPSSGMSCEREQVALAVTEDALLETREEHVALRAAVRHRDE